MADKKAVIIRIVFSIVLIVVGIAGYHIYDEVIGRHPDTHIVCQYRYGARGDEFVVTVQNRGNAPDNLVLTIGTKEFINSSNYKVIGPNVTPIGGAIPDVVGGNYITFRIKELLPYNQCVSIVMTDAGDTPRVEAWSDYTGLIPYSGYRSIQMGPEETNPNLDK